MKDPFDTPWPGLVLASIGSAIMLAALGILPLDESKLHAPRLILGVAGLAFAAAGGATIFHRNKRLNALFAAIILACFARIGLWATLTSNTDNLSGGIPFVPKEINVFIGKGVFGFGVLCSFAIMLYALKQAIVGEAVVPEKMEDE